MKTEKQIMEECLIICVKDVQEDIVKSDSDTVDIICLIEKVLEKSNIEINHDNIKKIENKIMNMYDVQHLAKVNRENCLDLAMYLLGVSDEVHKLAYKYKANEYNYRTFIMTCLLYIIHNIRKGIITTISIKEVYEDIFKENGGII